VDANSPTSDLAFAIELCNKFGIRMRGIRTRDRITIQEAWNLGIHESKSDFLMFLGVDETIYSDSLSSLLEKFEEEPDLDWVMGNSVIATVDSSGDLLNDVMIYKRDGASGVHPFLETCYVSYVAGLYRRNIHSRFGYYDPTFRGAGDTEFKSRVLPFLKVGYVNDTLGEFLNYPEDRTTASPIVELEDLRAWYIYRTVGGILYQSEKAGDHFLRELLAESFGYRKSYCGHTSIDLSLASEIYSALEYLGDLSSDERKSQALLKAILNHQEELFFLTPSILDFKRVISLLKLLYKLRIYLNKPEWTLRETYIQYKHDNIFEQHHWFW
jgi:glycosyltransferase involved in cell wall biosynthesis